MEKPTAELFLQHIFVERGTAPHTNWVGQWSFPWERDWLKDWFSPWANNFREPTGGGQPPSIADIFSRREAFGGLAYNIRTRAVYRVNSAGYELIQSLQSGKAISDISRDTGLSESEINAFIQVLLG